MVHVLITLIHQLLLIEYSIASDIGYAGQNTLCSVQRSHVRVKSRDTVKFGSQQ